MSPYFPLRQPRSVRVALLKDAPQPCATGLLAHVRGRGEGLMRDQQHAPDVGPLQLEQLGG